MADLGILLFLGCGERVIIKTKHDNGLEKSAVYRSWPLLENCDSPLSIHLTALAARHIGITAMDKTESKIEMRKLDKPFSHAREICELELQVSESFDFSLVSYFNQETSVVHLK